MNFFDIFRLPKFEYGEVVITRDVIDTILDMAKAASPLEFTALLSGKIKNKVLVISSIVFQQYEASEDATAMHMDLPLLHGTVGSVHSHPSGSNRASGTDLVFFNKHGIFHLIIAAPFSQTDIAAYDKGGGRQAFEIV
jgi:proteasome lid subunit RPN8/RPN11